VDRRDQALVINAAAASPDACRQWREGADLATAELAAQALHAADARCLPTQVPTGILQSMALATGYSGA
jgi:hypothetical protein